MEREGCKIRTSIAFDGNRVDDVVVMVMAKSDVGMAICSGLENAVAEIVAASQGVSHSRSLAPWLSK